MCYERVNGREVIRSGKVCGAVVDIATGGCNIVTYSRQCAVCIDGNAKLTRTVVAKQQ